MSTTAPSQLDPDSVDTAGLSIVTAPLGLSTRTGAAYDPVVFAAGAPVWFHPRHGGGHLMVCARSWSATSPGGGGAGKYATYTENLEPSWFVVSGGSRSTVTGHGASVPFRAPVLSPRLIAAASRPPDYLYLLHDVTLDSAPAALVQLQRVAPGGVSIYVEEIPPTLAVGEDTVRFAAGIQFADPFLYLYGTISTGAVYQIRKRWAELGGTTPWEYFTGAGFSPDAYRLVGDTPVLQATALPVTTTGPLSFGFFRNITLMSTVTATQQGQIWESRNGRPFTPAGPPVSLGAGAGYLGHGLALQSQLQANPAAPALAGTSGAVPYLVTTKTSGTGGSSLVNTWGLHPIRL